MERSRTRRRKTKKTRRTRQNERFVVAYQTLWGFGVHMLHLPRRQDRASKKEKKKKDKKDTKDKAALLGIPQSQLCCVGLHGA